MSVGDLRDKIAELEEELTILKEETSEVELRNTRVADEVYEMKHRLMLGLDADKSVADVLDEIEEALE